MNRKGLSLPLCVGILVAAAFAITAQPVAAQLVFGDHLKCIKIKDQRKNVFPKHLAFLDQFGLQDECRVDPQATLLCVEADKLIDHVVTPGEVEPPFVDFVGDFLCYKQLNCQTGKIPSGSLVVVEDQFGAGVVELKKDEMVCIPAKKHFVVIDP